MTTTKSLDPRSVLHEDNHLLIVDKPPLLPTMGTAQGEDSLVLRARSYLKHKYNKPGNVYIGVVSRLDAFTRGVVVLARTSKAAARLNRQFQSGQVTKTYLAVVSHKAPQSGLLEDHLLKDDKRQRMICVGKQHPEFAGARFAKLTYSTVDELKEFRLIEIQLLTGRKHQIRVQFASRGFPILGDRKYGSRLDFPRGIALMSAALSFQHPTREKRVTVIARTPERWPFDRAIHHYLNNLLSADDKPKL